MPEQNLEKKIKPVSMILGISIFLFGVLKFVDPFKGWYSAQITFSGLPTPAYWFGIVSEILVGLAFLIPFLLKGNPIIGPHKRTILSLASVSIIMIMLVATYVHLQPAVPSDVLPLKIKPPLIPGAFAFLGIYNLYHLQKNKG
ncbi:Hypothetical protein LBF_0130 [Leptospira biflexa serovar Patoc strain 'Patoc 1 (Ames)']|uniref:DoxX family protein n=1 Tax=Leptospira biflexa serovar Patoc (strain Patoc 1 / ATCC 23582 / Paris) TaxID=456481 RepID=B0SJW9_LEPBP|nr:hypothetical protein [Leptospira biflexa]ABZ92676.1 Hypothetical protein LBF_0130 [Leptospira biflexa serovar Patoc strain 'Patoc 1 (Ames)']ABZ96277.1 Hypothetical protein; putative membrane protein [Leptospira biflexa serovar Patoc strain 'Patoc 1 (Paris)']